jgi:hypothetical protein
METTIDLGALKGSNAAECKIDALVDKIKTLNASGDRQDQAAAIVFYDDNGESGKDELTAYAHGNAVTLGAGMIQTIITAAKSSSKTDKAQVALLMVLAANLIDAANKTAKAPELEMLALSANQIVKKFI